MIRQIIFSLFFLLVFPGNLLAAPQLVVNDESLKFNWPSVCKEPEPFSFLVYSEEGNVSNLQVVPQEAKAPDNSALSADAYEIPPYPTIVPPEGVKVSLILKKSFFASPGEYRITLLFKGSEGKPVSKIFRITRPAAGINLDELKDITVKLTRNWPWETVSGTRQLSLFEATRKAAINQLSISDLGIFQEKTKVLVPGQVKVAPASHTCLDANTRLPLTVTFSGLNQTGAFTTSVLLESPSLEKPIQIPLNLLVTDCWGFPFLVIFLGVAGGFGIRQLVKKYKPRQENTCRIVKLRGTIDHLGRVTTDPTKKIKLEDLDRRCRDVEDKNLVGDPTGAKTLLDQLEKDVDAFLQQQAIEYANTRNSLEDLRLKVDEYKDKYSEDSNLKGTVKYLDEAERHLSVQELDQAKGLLPKAQGKFDEFLKSITPTPTIKGLAGEKGEEPEAITVLNGPENRSTDSRISFQIKGNFPPDCLVQWYFGDGSSPFAGGMNFEHTYDRPGSYRVEAQVAKDQNVLSHLSILIMILPGQKEKSLAEIRKTLLYIDLTISGVAFLLAAITGLLYLYLGTGKPFGTIQDYLLAFTWGFGIDNSVRGFASVLKVIGE
jgi:PKD domain